MAGTSLLPARFLPCFVLAFLSVLTALIAVAEAQHVVWERQFAPPAGAIEATAVTTDPSGAPYVTGWTTGTLPGESSAGLQDGFVRKYDSAGNILWTRQFGSSIPSTGGFDASLGAAADIAAVYLVGRTSGAFAGQDSAGGVDLFIRKYDREGNEVWTRQLGSAANEWEAAIAVFDGHSYVAGTVGAGGSLPGQTNSGGEDVFLAKYDPAGNIVWLRQFGSTGFGGFDQGSAIAVDASGVYVGGHAEGILAGDCVDAVRDSGCFLRQFQSFIQKFDLDGNLLWSRRLHDLLQSIPAGAIAADGSNVYVEAENARGGYVYRLSAATGAKIWTRQLGQVDGIPPPDLIVGSAGLALNGSDLYLLSFSTYVQPGNCTPGWFVRKYDRDGNELWTRRVESQGIARSLATTGDALYVAGRPVPSADALLTKLDPSTPPPAPDFCITVTPPSVTVFNAPQSTAGLQVQGVLRSGDPVPINFEVFGVPSGVSAVFSPASCTATCASTLLITSSATAPLGTYELRIAGTSGGITSAVTLTLQINQAPFQFQLSLSPTADLVLPGFGTSSTVTATLISGAPRQATFLSARVPLDTTVSFAPASCLLSCATTATIATSRSTPVGVYGISLIARAGNSARAVNYDLSVVTPRQMINWLIGQVGDLTLAGVLSAGVGNSLGAKLAAAGAAVDDANAATANNMAVAALNELNALVGSGRVSESVVAMLRSKLESLAGYLEEGL